MSLLNKVKNFFYEEVEEDEDEILRKEEEKRRAKELKREEKRRAELEKLARETTRREEKRIEAEQKELEREQEKDVENRKDDLSERELFKSERTFNFPMDMGDDIFDDAEVTSEYKEEKTVYTKPSPAPSRYANISKTQSYVEPKKVEEEDNHRFKPSPVISPVYGILDKNYTVEDVKEKNLGKTKEFSLEKKHVDFDSVRNRAYKELDEEIEKTLTGKKDIFYNIEEETPVDDFKEDAYDAEENDVVITYDNEEEYEEPTDSTVNDLYDQEEVEVPAEETEEEDLTPDVSIAAETRTERKSRKSKKAKETKEEPEEDDEKEDLFNLIDNMYNDDDEEEDE